jgi:6-pyruvoyl-tetrahydropterin synthase
MFTYIVTEKGSVGHNLESYNGPCANAHGHTIKVEAEFTFYTLPEETNMKVDFKLIKSWMKEFVPDHVYLNDYYDEYNPTAEFLSRVIYASLDKRIKEYGLTHNETDLALKRVTVWESETAGCCYEVE